MELRNLIKETHDLHEQLKQLLVQEASVKEKIEIREAELKIKLDEKGDDYENLTEEEFQSLMADLADPMKMTVEVVYATNDEQHINEVQLSRGATIEDGIFLSGILDKCKELKLSDTKVGIHGVIKPLTDSLSDGDRIEIYRPLIAKI